MDQTASAAAVEGSAILFDTDSRTTELVPLDPGAEGFTLLTIDTRVSHDLSDGAYADRRAACEEATRLLDIRSLRDLGVEALPQTLLALRDPVLRRRVRHVVNENDRVRKTVGLLRDRRLGAIGPLLTGSHRSLQYDYEVSCLELDLAVDTALANGAHGARMTGGGFGGTVLALTRSSGVGAVTDAVLDTFDRLSLTTPVIRAVRPAAGAHQVLRP